jgi:hypothetical protein
MWTDQDREKYKDDGRRYPSDLTDVEWATIKRGCSAGTMELNDIRGEVRTV